MSIIIQTGNPEVVLVEAQKTLTDPNFNVRLTPVPGREAHLAHRGVRDSGLVVPAVPLESA